MDADTSPNTDPKIVSTLSELEKIAQSLRAVADTAKTFSTYENETNHVPLTQRWVKNLPIEFEQFSQAIEAAAITLEDAQSKLDAAETDAQQHLDKTDALASEKSILMEKNQSLTKELRLLRRLEAELSRENTSRVTDEVTIRQQFSREQKTQIDNLQSEADRYEQEVRNLRELLLQAIEKHVMKLETFGPELDRLKNYLEALSTANANEAERHQRSLEDALRTERQKGEENTASALKNQGMLHQKEIEQLKSEHKVQLQVQHNNGKSQCFADVTGGLTDVIKAVTSQYDRIRTKDLENQKIILELYYVKKLIEKNNSFEEVVENLKREHSDQLVLAPDRSVCS
jgi:hypothetical protein